MRKDATGYKLDAIKTESEKFASPSPFQEIEIAGIGRTDELQCLPYFSSCCLLGFLGAPSIKRDVGI